MIIIFKRRRVLTAILVFVMTAGLLPLIGVNARADNEPPEKKYIKWVDFDITAAAMKKALALDVEARNAGNRCDWIELLAYLGAKYGGNFKKYKASDLDAAAKRVCGGEAMEDIAKDMKHYGYYLEAYGAVLSGFVGEYEIETEDESGNIVWKKKYGLKAFSPIAKGFPYSDFDDFGEGRSYGYKRKHLGHDFMAQVGTPVVAVESGVVEELGWNQYGGWRMGIRSFDGKRYYYYAHLRKNHPYNPNVSKGGTVTAGDIIGYVGRTGYSRTENTNNITQSHLHFGMQLIFDESQKDGTNQIWIDVYAITNFLSSNRSEGVRDSETKDYYRKYKLREEGGNGTAAAISEIQQIKLPVIMYHDIFKDSRRLGIYAISPEQFESDLKYLKENGYETVTTRQLAAFVYEGTQLPDKPILLTFDDGHYNNVHYAEPLLKKYGMRATIFIVGDFCDRATKEGENNPNYSFISWDELEKLYLRGTFEIGNHSWGCHGTRKGFRGVLSLRGEDCCAYEKRLTEDLTRLQSKIFMITGEPPAAFAYPFGCISEDSSDIIKNSGLTSSFCSRSGVSTITRGDPESLYDICRIVRSNKLPASGILQKYM